MTSRADSRPPPPPSRRRPPSSIRMIARYISPAPSSQSWRHKSLFRCRGGTKHPTPSCHPSTPLPSTQPPTPGPGAPRPPPLRPPPPPEPPLTTSSPVPRPACPRLWPVSLPSPTSRPPPAPPILLPPGSPIFLSPQLVQTSALSLLFSSPSSVPDTTPAPRLVGRDGDRANSSPPPRPPSCLITPCAKSPPLPLRLYRAARPPPSLPSPPLAAFLPTDTIPCRLSTSRCAPPRSPPRPLPPDRCSYRPTPRPTPSPAHPSPLIPQPPDSLTTL